MKQLLIRADDLGYSYAVDLGIARSVNEGLVRSAGLMPNMHEAERGWSIVADEDIAIGQHTNLCLGRPCAGPADIPSLVEGTGHFKSSRAFREAWQRGEDFVVLDECVIEVEAQLERFREVVGRDPDYFEAHAVASATVGEAIHVVAERHGLREQQLVFGSVVRCGATDVRLAFEGNLAPEEYDPAGLVRRAVEGMVEGETVVLVFHPGYLDSYILQTSSLTTNRTKEVDALIDPALRAWLEAQEGLRLVDYRDL